MPFRKLLLAAALSFNCLAVVCPGARAQGNWPDHPPMAPEPPAPTRPGGRAAAKEPGGLTTLYTLDPLASSLCFADGKDGRVFQENEMRNRCSDLDFGSYSAGSFSVGVEGGRIGVIIDLGDAGEMEARYGYRETVGNAQGFASLHAEGERILVLKESRPQTFQDLKESGQLFAEGKSVASAPVKVGHIYLVRITDRHDRGFQRLAKLKVVSYAPGESVTVRWQVL